MSALRALIIESSSSAATLADELSGNFHLHWHGAASEAELGDALAAGPWDVVLAGYSPPGIAVANAIARCRAAAPHLPVIVVAGPTSAGPAVELMRAGACDYLPEGQLPQLASVVARAVKEATAHRARLDGDRNAALLAAIVNSSEDAVVSADADGVVLSWNPAAERLFGHTASEAIGRSNFELLVPPDRMAESRERVERVRRGEHLPPLDTVRLRKGGGLVHVSVTVSAVVVAGRVVGLSAVYRDATERVRTEVERELLLARLRTQIDRLPMGYLMFDTELRLVDWNPAAEQMFGYRKEEVLGMGPPFELLVPPSGWPQCREVVRRLRAGDMTANSVSENRTRDGRTIICEWNNTPLMGAGGRFLGLLALARDITDKVRLEEQYRQAQKLEAIGRLAGGVAHDFNNLLTIINGCASLLLSSALPGTPNRPLLEEVLRAGERAAALTRQLLTFSRKQVVAPKVLDLNTVAADAGRMLGRLIGEDVVLTPSLSPRPLWVLADGGQVEQVLMNLAVNARDAMPNGGRLTVETAEAELDEAYARAHAGVKPGPFALLAVSDTGTGMSDEVKARIFEPFFTTKGPGKGTGLGLAVVHGIVQSAGGHVGVYSEVGRGTTFKVYLPLAPGPAGQPRPQSEVFPPPPGTETVLVVEDEGAVRSLTRHVLTGCGYTVLEAGHGEEALRVAAAHAGPIAALVTDVVMPVMGGRQLAEALRQVRPGLRVLYVSGYAPDAVVRHGVLEESVPFLQKPFSPLALARKLREVLDAPG